MNKVLERSSDANKYYETQGLERPSAIDMHLLSDEIAEDFGLLINQFLKDKTSEV